MKAVSLNPVITLVSVADYRELMAISISTFTDTYAHVNTPENMRNYINTNFSEIALKEQISTPGTQFYLLMLDGRTMGYLKLNSGAAQTELKSANTLEIERIYVSKELQGKGMGRLLVEKAREVAIENKLDHLWLGVWENNFSALGFYRQLGFVEFDRHVFMLGNDRQTDIMMKLELINT